MTTVPERSYPIRPRPDDDPRFNLGLVIDVRQVLADHGYPPVEHGLDIVDLQQALFRFLYGDRKHSVSEPTPTDARSAATAPVCPVCQNPSCCCSCFGKTPDRLCPHQAVAEASKDTTDRGETTRTPAFPPRGGHREACAYASGISSRCTCHLGEFVTCRNSGCARGEWSAKAAERGWEKQPDGSWLDPQCAANAEDRLDYLAAVERAQQQPATLQFAMDGPVTLGGWNLDELAPDFYGRIYMQLGGWLPEDYADTVAGGTNELVRATLPGKDRELRSLNVTVEVKGYGGPRKYMKIQWPKPAGGQRQGGDGR